MSKSKNQESIRKLATPTRLGCNEYGRKVKDTFKLLKPKVLSDSDQRKHFSDVQKVKHKQSSRCLVKIKVKLYT